MSSTKEYLLQKDILNRLRREGKATFTKTSFIQAVNRGIIPFHMFDGFKKKQYVYDEVVKAIGDAGIGKPSESKNHKLDDLPNPQEGESKEEYGERVKELGDEPTLTDANIYKTLYAGKLEKLKFERESGLVISRELVEDKAFAVSRSIRDKILSIPERMSNELASINDAHIIKELLYKEFGMMLDGFSEDSFL